jgi:hypothetical protein
MPLLPPEFQRIQNVGIHSRRAQDGIGRFVMGRERTARKSRTAVIVASYSFHSCQSIGRLELREPPAAFRIRDEPVAKPHGFYNAIRDFREELIVGVLTPLAESRTAISLVGWRGRWMMGGCLERAWLSMNTFALIVLSGLLMSSIALIGSLRWSSSPPLWSGSCCRWSRSPRAH